MYLLTNFGKISIIKTVKRLLILYLLILSGCYTFVRKPILEEKLGKVIEQDIIFEQVSLDGTSIRCETKTIIFNDRKESPSSISISYTPGYNEAKFLYAMIIKENGDTINLDINNAKDIPAPAALGGTIFWGDRNIELPVSGIADSDRLEYSTEIIGGTWLGPMGDKNHMTPYPGYFNYIELFQEFDTPIKYKEYVLKIPREKKISYRIYNGELDVSRQEKSDSVIYKFVGRDIPGVSYEPMMGSRYNNFLKLIISNISSWEKLSQLESDLSRANLEPNDYVTSFTDSLLMDAKTDIEKINRLFYFVSKIRYLGLIEEKREGYAPHPPEITLKKRSGVCKDKAALLVAMLKASGLDAYYAITMVGARIEDFPADQTNHAIVGLKWNDRIIYLDPTIGAGGRAWLPPFEWGQEIINASDEGDTLREIPIGNICENQEGIEIKDNIKGDTLISEIKGTFSGDFDRRMRRAIRGKGSEEVERYISNTINSFTRNFDIGNYEIMDVDDFSKNFSMSTNISSTPIIHTKNIKLLRPLIFNYSLPYFFRYGFSKEKRNFPLNLYSVSGYLVEEEIHLSPADRIISIPEPFFYSDDYLTMELRVQNQDDTINLKRRIEVKKTVVPVRDYKKLYQAVKSFINKNKGWVIYR